VVPYLLVGDDTFTPGATAGSVKVKVNTTTLGTFPRLGCSPPLEEHKSASARMNGTQPCARRSDTPK
jgi:hypothetical protein